jgi:hypothetical protein
MILQDKYRSFVNGEESHLYQLQQVKNIEIKGVGENKDG